MNLHGFIILKNTAKRMAFVGALFLKKICWLGETLKCCWCWLLHGMSLFGFFWILVSRQELRGLALTRQTSVSMWWGRWVWLSWPGGASIPNYLHHPTSDLLIEGSFVLNFFRQTPEVTFASKTGREHWKREINLTWLSPDLVSSCVLVAYCMSGSLVASR